TLIKNQFKKIEVYLQKQKVDKNVVSAQQKELEILISETQKILDKAKNKKIIRPRKLSRLLGKLKEAIIELESGSELDSSTVGSLPVLNKKKKDDISDDYLRMQDVYREIQEKLINQMILLGFDYHGDCGVESLHTTLDKEYNKVYEKSTDELKELRDKTNKKLGTATLCLLKEKFGETSEQYQRALVSGSQHQEAKKLSEIIGELKAIRQREKMAVISVQAISSRPNQRRHFSELDVGKIKILEELKEQGELPNKFAFLGNKLRELVDWQAKQENKQSSQQEPPVGSKPRRISGAARMLNTHIPGMVPGMVKELTIPCKGKYEDDKVKKSVQKEIAELIKEINEIEVKMMKKRMMIEIDKDYSGLLEIMEQFIKKEKKQVNELNKQITKLDNDNNKLRRELLIKENKINDLGQENIGLEEENDKLKKNNSKLNQKQKEWEQEKNRIGEMSLQVLQGRENVKAKLAATKERLAEKEQELATSIRERENLTDENTKLSNQNDELKAQVDNSKEQLTRIPELETDLAEVLQENEELRKKCQDLENNEAQKSYQQVNDLNFEIGGLEIDFKKLGVDNEGLRQEILRLLMLLTGAKQRIFTLTDNDQKIRNNFQQALQRLAEVKQEKENYKTNLGSQILVLNNQLRASQQDTRDLENALETTQAVANQEINQREEQNEKLKNQRQIFQTRCQKANHQVGILEIEKEELKRSLDYAKRVSQSTAESATLTNRVTEEAEEIAEERDAAINERDAARRELQDLERAGEILLTNFEATENEINDLKRQLAAAGDQTQEDKSTIQDLENKDKKEKGLQNNLKIKKKENRLLKEKNSRITELVQQEVKNDLEQKLNEKEQDLIIAEELLESKNGKIAVQHKELDRQQAEHQKIQNKLNKKLEKTSLNLTNVGIKQKNTKLLNKQGKQDQKINNLQGERRSLQLDLRNKDDEIRQLQQDNQGLQRQLQQEKNRADNLQAWKDNHNCVGCYVAAHADYDIIKQERDNYQQQINDHKCPSVDNRELESLREEMRVKDKKIEQLEQEIEILKDKPPLVGNKQEVERLSGVITEKEQIIKELEIKLQAQPREVMVESGETAKLKNKLGQQENKIKQLHIIYLILLGASVLVGVGAVRLAGKKRLKRVR
ncbi:2883_t:CDS:2, partial [Cetraspora pellucida]